MAIPEEKIQEVMSSLMGTEQTDMPDNSDSSGEEPEPKIKITDSKGLKTGDYSKKHIEGIIKAAKHVGIDPYSALALALQETGIGQAKIKMRRGLKQAPFAMVHDFSPEQQKELDDTEKSTGIGTDYLKLAIALRDKLKYAERLGFKDEAAKLQAYNGYGFITKKNFGGAEKAYGVPIGAGIDMKKNPLYGKRLIELKSDIAKNKDILALMGSPKPASTTTSKDIFNKVKTEELAGR